MRIHGPRILPATALALVFAVASPLGAPAADPDFTAEERQWLATKPTLTVGADPLWPPFSTVDASGALSGIDRDMLDLISARTGIQFKVVSAPAWEGVEALARQGKVDILCGTAKTPEREQFAKFTRPYVPTTVAIITRKDGAFLTSVRQLEGRRVAAPRSHVTSKALAADYPGIQLVLTDNFAEALRKVDRSEADATVSNLTTATYTILSEGLADMKISGVTDYSFDVRYAVVTPGPALAVLDKTLASIPQREVAAIVDRWTGIDFHREQSSRSVRRALLWAGGIAAAIVLLVLLRNRLLARELAERRKVERQLSLANGALRTASEEKGMLMQMLAHDLNSPLTVLTGYCDLLAERSKSDPQTVADIRTMQSAIGRMTKLVGGLLTADAVESGSRQLVMRKLCLCRAARDATEQLRDSASAKQITLQLRDPGECLVSADELALGQVIENLVSNAIKFTPSRGSVEVTVTTGAGFAEARVADTGPGVCESERPQLFRKFCRLSAKPTAGETSHGLGLMMVKHLTESMGGTIRHEPREGGGSIFIARFKV